MTPYAESINSHYKFSDGSAISQVKASNGNPSNYRFFMIEPIKWIVLNYGDISDKSLNGGDKELPGVKKGELYELLANNALAAGVPQGNMRWESSTLRRYLNNQLYGELVSHSHQQLVKPSVIYNNTNEADSNLMSTGSNSNYLTSGSNPTTQSLYLLSRYEVDNSNSPYVKNGIFGTNNAADTVKRQAFASDYAKAHYLYLELHDGNPIPFAYWWLRTTSESKIYRTDSLGKIGNYNNENGLHIGARPAMQRSQECPY